MAFLKLSTSRKCSRLLLQESLRNDVCTRLVRSLSASNGPKDQQHQQHRNNSITATASAGTIDVKPKWDQLDTSFADPEATFKSKTTWEILRAYIVYQLCSSSYLVENNMQVINNYYWGTLTWLPLEVLGRFRITLFIIILHYLLYAHVLMCAV